MGRRTLTSAPRRLAVAGIVLAIALSGCAHGPRPLASVDAGQVHVTVQFSQAHGRGSLRVKLVPDHSGFHVYSKDLNPATAKGLGIPTRVVLVSGLQPDGAQTASPAPHNLRVAQLDAVVPVYPPGPVTIVTPTRAPRTHTATIAVSYAACSDKVCLQPVMNRRITFALPA